MVRIQIFETGDRFDINNILPTDSIAIVKQKISDGLPKQFLLPPEWIYMWKLDKNKKEMSLGHKIEGQKLTHPHVDYPKYKNGSLISLKSIKDLSNDKIDDVDNIFISSIFIAFQKFVIPNRPDLITYVSLNNPLPSEYKSIEELNPFLKGYVRRYWPNINSRDAAIIIYWSTSSDLRGNNKSQEIKDLKDKLISEKKRRVENINQFQSSEDQMNALVTKHIKDNDKIKLEQLTISVDTKPKKPIDLFSIFRGLKLSSEIPFMKIKNPKHKEGIDDILINMLRSIKDLPQVTGWVKNKPRGINFKVKSGIGHKGKFLDVSLNRGGTFVINCGRDQSKLSCLNSIQSLIDKINKLPGRFELTNPNSDNVYISSVNASLREEQNINHKDLFNFIFKNKLYSQYYKFSSRKDELREKQRIVKAGTKHAHRLIAQLNGLDKETVTQIAYENEYNNISRINVKILEEKESTVVKVFGIRNMDHVQEILNRTISIIREFVIESKRFKRKSSLIEKKIKESKNPILEKLRIFDPHIITTSSYSVKCGKDKQPLVWSKDEFDKLDKNDYSYGMEYRGRWYTCRKGQIPGKKSGVNFPNNPGLQSFEDFHQVVAILEGEEQIVDNNLSEKAAIKTVNKFKKKNPGFKGQIVVRENELKNKILWPCCFVSDRRNKIIEQKRSVGDNVSLVSRTSSAFLIKTDKVLDENRISDKLPNPINNLFVNSRSSSDDSFFRYGTITSDSSFFVAVMAATRPEYREMNTREQKKFIDKNRKKISEKLPKSKFNALNGGEISNKFTLSEYKKLIEKGVLSLELIHDFCTRGFGKNIFVFSSKEGNIICAAGNINLKRESVFLLENAPNHYEVIFKGPVNKKTFVFPVGDEMVEKIYKLWKLNCPRVIENDIKKLNKKIKLIAQIPNHRGKIIYGITSSGIPLPVKESKPLELPIKKLSKIKMTANETDRRLNLLNRKEFKPESQIILEDRVVAIILKNGSIVPVKESLKVKGLPIERDVDFSDDLDFFIKEEISIENAQTKFTRKETYSKELIERARFELSELFKDSPQAKKRMINALDNREKIRKVLDDLIIAFDAPGGIKEIKKNEIPQRTTCRTKTKGSCLSDPFCRYRGGSCELSITNSDKKRIIHKVANELYHGEKKSQILLGTVQFHGTTFVLRPDEVILEGSNAALDFLGKNK